MSGNAVAQDIDWPERLYQTFKRAGIRQVGYVPDAGHAQADRSLPRRS